MDRCWPRDPEATLLTFWDYLAEEAHDNAAFDCLACAWAEWLAVRGDL
jgi:hypothetical protein